MSTPVRVSYILPVHNDAATIALVVEQIAERLRSHPGSEVILVENASTDDSLAECKRLAERTRSSEVRVIASHSDRGMGNALREGLRHSTGELIVLTASDLPFGFTDLDACLALEPRPPLVLGSKGHPDSQVGAPLLRRVMSAGFRLLRQVTLGISAADTQGTVLIDGDVARQLLPELRCADYLITTEVVAWAARNGVVAVEVPVVYHPPTASTVSPLRDAIRMALGLLRLRARLRDAAIAGLAEATTPPHRLSSPLAVTAVSAAVFVAGLTALLGCLVAVGLLSRLLALIGPLGTNPSRAAAVAWVITLCMAAGAALSWRRRTR